MMGVEAGEERGLVTRTGVNHSDVSGRTWAKKQTHTHQSQLGLGSG